MDTIKLLVPEIDTEINNKRQKMNFSSEGSARLKKSKASRVPEQTRIYSPGDPTNLIDWKLYARTDQLLLREHKDQTALTIGVCLVYDQTMSWPDLKVTDRTVTSKWEIACRVAFHIAFQHLNCGDRVKFFLKKDDGIYDCKLLSASSVMKIFNSLDEDYNIANLMQYFNLSNMPTKNEDKLYLISDLIEPIEYSEFEAYGIISVKHVLSSLDVNYDWLDKSSFYAADSGLVDKVKGAALNDTDFLQDEVLSWLGSKQEELEKFDSHYQLLTDETGLDEYLSELSWEMKA